MTTPHHDWTCSCGAQHETSCELLEHMDHCPDWNGAGHKPETAKCGPRKDAPPL